MKKLDHEGTAPTEIDHDSAWRERIQRALRDLRSGSSIGMQSNQAPPRTE